ncbi:uncharacterized protein LOC143552220 isoform X2 [Bidens hawaiensis]|uniref:uncharacterized protein LOC143552220 isoform X2 n=1 Tax=Bidens hawaiensis TaxID=980011 RepID=UPI0040495F7F
MEAAVTGRAISITMPSSQSQSSRNERRVVSDHLSQNSGNEDLDRSKLGQGDERLIYEVHQGRESVNGDSFSVTVDGVNEHELHLEEIVKQREQLQHIEVNMKARLIANSEMMGIQERYESQIKEHITSNLKLQEQLHEREKTIMDLQRTLDDKDKELHAIRLDHEAAWAKEDLLKQQNKELATFRRERDNSEAERTQHLQKILELQEHAQEKETQLMELQEQHRAAQETIIYKDEQIREAQAWIARVQEMDALQSTTNHSLQAELRERTEQYNQLWIGCQRQFAEMERLHLHTLQQLEKELIEAREKNGNSSSNANKTTVKETSHFVDGSGNQLEASSIGNNPSDDSRSLQNGDAEIVSSQTKNITSAQMNPQSLHGMPAYYPPGQLAALPPFILHHPQNVNPHLLQSHVGQFYSLPASSSIQHWQSQQAFTEGLQMPNHEQYSPQNDQNQMRQETNYDYEASVNGQTMRSEFMDGVPSKNEEQSLQQISSQFHASLRLNQSDNDIALQEKNLIFLSNHGSEAHISSIGQLTSAVIAPQVIQSVKASGALPNKVDIVTQNNSSGGKTAEKALFDEETLLACVVRTIPPGPGGRIQISSTLLTRLTKMLSPLRWSDYENKHGKLDSFLGSHPELFVIEGDYIQVREGAQEIIASMVARAKVRAATVAASAAASHPSKLSSVAVTPMAQTRLKRVPSTESQNSNSALNPIGARVLGKNNDQMKHVLANGNGVNMNRPNLGSQSKVINNGRSGPNYHGKQQGRSSGSLPGSRK